MGKIITFANQKGGVGKTTSAVNVAAALGEMGKRTLLVDADPQGNASSGVGVLKREKAASLYPVLLKLKGPAEVIRETPFENLSVLPSSIDLAAAEFELVDLEKREGRLRETLAEVRDAYDYIVVDCPPSLGLLTVNALTAADGVVIPMQCEYYALEGLSQLTVTIRQVRRAYNPALELTGILVTMYNGRLNLSMMVLDELKKYYADKLFSTMVTRVVKLSEAPSYGMPGICYDKFGKGSEAYRKIARELTERI